MIADFSKVSTKNEDITQTEIICKEVSFYTSAEFSMLLKQRANC